MNIKIFIILLFSISCFSFLSEEKNTAMENSIQLNLSNIKNNKGTIYVFVFVYENQYPDNPYKYFKFEKKDVKDGKLQVQLPKFKIPGRFAISVLDDENDNEDMDQWFGIPAEGYGFSNNVKPFLSFPDYADLLVDTEHSKRLNIKLQYIF